MQQYEDKRCKSKIWTIGEETAAFFLLGQQHEKSSKSTQTETDEHNAQQMVCAKPKPEHGDEFDIAAANGTTCANGKEQEACSTAKCC